MEHFIEFLAELIGNITGRAMPERMPEDLPLKEEFVVKPYPKSIAFGVFAVLLCFAVAIPAYIGNGTVFAAIFVALGIALLVIGIFSDCQRYEFNTERITVHRPFRKPLIIPWSCVRCVRLYEFTNDGTAAIALYGEERLLTDLTSPKKNFWHVQKLAEHLGYEVVTEIDPSLKRILNP